MFLWISNCDVMLFKITKFNDLNIISYMQIFVMYLEIPRYCFTNILSAILQ